MKIEELLVSNGRWPTVKGPRKPYRVDRNLTSLSRAIPAMWTSFTPFAVEVVQAAATAMAEFMKARSEK